MSQQQAHDFDVPTLRRASQRVVPGWSTPSGPRSSRSERNGGTSLICRFGLAPRSSIIFTSSVPEVASGARAVGATAGGHRVHVHDGVERRAAPRIPHVQLRALFHEEARRHRS